MDNTFKIEFMVNGKVEAFYLSTGSIDEIDSLKKKLEVIILEDIMWSKECPMKGRQCQCSSREKCIHYRK